MKGQIREWEQKEGEKISHDYYLVEDKGNKVMRDLVEDKGNKVRRARV